MNYLLLVNIQFRSFIKKKAEIRKDDYSHFSVDLKALYEEFKDFYKEVLDIDDSNLLLHYLKLKDGIPLRANLIRPWHDSFKLTKWLKANQMRVSRGVELMPNPNHLHAEVWDLA